MKRNKDLTFDEWKVYLLKIVVETYKMDPDTFCFVTKSPQEQLAYKQSQVNPN